MCGGVILLALMAVGCIDFKKGPEVVPVKTETITFRPADHIRIELIGKVGDQAIPPREEEVKSDGSINIEYVGSIDVTGKTPKEVEQIIYTNLVPRIYRTITVTVTPLEMMFFVGGQVNHPGPIRYSGKITLTKAIQAAGDFTDFANIRNIQLTRADGKVVFVNYKKAARRPADDPEIFPHDQITVERRM
jgi:polysaccharide export outer membrane protein